MRIRKEEGSGAEHDPRALAASFDSARNRILLVLEGGVEISFPVAALGFSAQAYVADVQVDGGGFDLYFPSIDDGCFVPDLVRSLLLPGGVIRCAVKPRPRDLSHSDIKPDASSLGGEDVNSQIADSSERGS